MLTLSIILVLASNAITNRRDLSISFNRVLIGIFTVALIISLRSNNFVVLDKGVSLLGGLFHNTSLCINFHSFILFVSIIILQLTAFFPRNYVTNDINSNKGLIKNIVNTLLLSNKTKEQYAIIEYPLITLFIIVGAMFLISSSDVISIFLSIELQSYGLYLLCALYRNSESSTGAGLTYFLLGGLSSCFILLASGLLYSNSGTSNLDTYYVLTNLSDVKYTINNFVYWYNNDYVNYSLVVLSVGFLFKISAAPFHFWSPDVYDAIPTIVTTFVANIAKISILVFMLEIVHYTTSLTISNFNWTNCLLLSSLLSLIIGTVLGLNQSRIKRLLAYSTISHLGFMLLAISVNSIESLQAFIFYLMQYSISNITGFILIISIGYTLYMYRLSKQEEKQGEEEKILIDQDNSPIQYTSQLKGYYFINPNIAISLAVIIYSFVGIPPLVGFFGKQMVLSSALDKGYVFISLVAILTSVISAVYYLNIVKEIFFEKSDYMLNNSGEENKDNNESSNNVKQINIIGNYDYSSVLSTNLAATIAMFTLVITLFMLNPQQWLSMSNILAITTYN